MGLFRTLKSIVDPEVMGEEIVSTVEKMYALGERLGPGYDPHAQLAKAWISRMRARGIEVTNEMQFVALAETRQFAALPPPSNSRALGLYFLFKERPDIVSQFPKFSRQYDALMSPIFKALEDDTFEGLYAHYNPSFASGEAGSGIP
jgi:hypothetical protein